MLHLEPSAEESSQSKLLPSSATRDPGCLALTQELEASSNHLCLVLRKEASPSEGTDVSSPEGEDLSRSLDHKRGASTRELTEDLSLGDLQALTKRRRGRESFLSANSHSEKVERSEKGGIRVRNLIEPEETRTQSGSVPMIKPHSLSISPRDASTSASTRRLSSTRLARTASTLPSRQWKSSLGMGTPLLATSPPASSRGKAMRAKQSPRLLLS